MDSEKDMEEYQGRQVFVSQLLDWDSLIHQLIIPADKAEAFKKHFNSPQMVGITYILTILFEGREYKAFAQTEGFTQSSYSKHSQQVYSEQSQKMQSGHVLVSQTIRNAIQLIYSPQLVQALKDTFVDLFQHLSKNKERKDTKGNNKTHIRLVAGDSPNVFILNYSTQASSSQSKSDSLKKYFKVASRSLEKLRTNVSGHPSSLFMSSEIDEMKNNISSKSNLIANATEATALSNIDGQSDCSAEQSEEDNIIEEYQGHKVFLNQLLDWNSLTHELVIPAVKARAFKAHFKTGIGIWRNNIYSYNTHENDRKSHPITILFDKGGYKAFVQDLSESSDNQPNAIRIQYSEKLSQALKDKFRDVYQWLDQNRNNENAELPKKIRIYLTASYSVDVFLLKYSIECEWTAVSIETTSEAVDGIEDESSNDLQDVASLNSLDSPLSTEDTQPVPTTVLEDSEADETTSFTKLDSFTLADDIPSLVYTRPIDFSYDCGAYKVHSWTDFIVKVAKFIYKTRFGFLLKTAMPEDFDFSNQYCLGEIPARMKNPKNIADGFWIETNLSSTQLAQFAKWMAKWCKLEPKDFLVHYEKRENLVEYGTSVVDKIQEPQSSPDETFLKFEDIGQNDSHETIEDKILAILPSDAFSFTLADNLNTLKLSNKTRPLNYIYNGQTHTTVSWSDFVVQIAKIVYSSEYGHLLKLPVDLNFTNKKCLCESPNGMINPERVGVDLWIETAMRETKLAKFAQWMVKWCYLEPKDFLVHYEKKNPILTTKEHLELHEPIQTRRSSQDESFKHEEDALRRIIFSKRLNWSMMTLGMTIPVDMIPLFLSHLSFQPIRGQMYPVTLIWDGMEYSVKMEDVNYSSEKRYQTVQIRYTPSSPFAIALKNKFQSAYRQMELNHKNTEGIDTTVTLVTTSRLNCFKLEIAQNQISVSKSVEPLTSKQKDINDYSEPIVSSITGQEQISTDFIEECRQILETAFPRGFKNGSVIDKEKFIYKYEELFCKSLTDEEIEQVWEICTSIGNVVDDKVFPLSIIAKEFVQSKIESEISSEVEYPEVSSVLKTVSSEIQQFTDKCRILLEEFFDSGFRLNSPIANKRFRSFWKEKYLEECDFNDEEIQKAMKRIGVEFAGRIYAPKLLVSQEVFNELKQYIEHLFASGKSVIYYQALFDEFTRRETDWKINSTEMLKSYLAAFDWPYSFRRSCIAINNNIVISPIIEIRDYLREQQQPVGYDKLQAALPHIPLDVIKHELSTNTEFINTSRGEYMHADIVDLSEMDLKLISDLIQSEIYSKGYITGTELWSKLENDYSEYTIRYSHLPLVGFRDSLKHKFIGKFSFQGNVISSLDDPISMANIFAGFCRNKKSFTLSDLDSLREDVDAPTIYFDSVYDNSIRIDQNDFVSPESISFDTDAVDEAIECFCRGEFIAITDITSFAAFPSMEVQWTSFLVETFVSKYSRKFKLFHNQYNITVCAGAIVRTDAKLYDYNQVLAVVLARSKCELDSTTALDYLCNAGYLGRRRYKDIDIVLSQARQIRSRER